MVMLADLHTHTTASDGQYSPTELVQMAKSRGLNVLAVTDHDTLAGLAEACQAGRAYGVKVIPGIELSACEYPTFHILGYGFRVDNDALTALCRRMENRRTERIPRLLAFLGRQGVELDREEVEVLAGNAVVGRPHFARAMLQRGYVSSMREAFDRYLDTPDYHQEVESGKPTARECVETIKAAGGKVSLAHPYQIGLPEEALSGLVEQLTRWGLDAIECFYPRHTAEQTAFYQALAVRYGLYATGGSDFHGEKVKPDIELAAMAIELNWLI